MARSGIGTIHALSSGRVLRRVPMPELPGYPDTCRVPAQAVAASCGSRSGAVGAIILGNRGSGAGSCDRCSLQHGERAGDAL